MMPANLHLIGGEMLVWSDDPADGGPAAGGPAVAELLRGLSGQIRPGGRALVAGRHDDALPAVLAAAGLEVTCLVRGLRDAERMAQSGLRVLCGHLGKLDPAETFDLVVAAAGLDRLVSAEGPQLSWAETAALLTAAVAPAGTLLLVQENLLGLSRLTAMTPWYADRTDADWTPAGAFDDSRPGSLDGLTAALAGAGLDVAEPLLAYPDPARPSVLAPATAAGDPAVRPALQFAVEAATARYAEGRRLLADPRPLAADAIRSGAAAAFAPAWVVVATRTAAGGPADSALITGVGAATHRRPAPSVHDQRGGGERFVIADERPAPWALTLEVVRDSTGWHRRVLGDRQSRGNGGLTRRPDLLDGRLPTGRSLREQLLALCLRRDIPALRAVLTRYADAVRADADGTVTGAHLFHQPDDLVIDGGPDAGGDLRQWDPSWSAELRVPADVVIARGLRAFAADLVHGGHAHPWPRLGGVDDLARLLGALAGRTWDGTDVLERAAELHERLVAAGRDVAVPVSGQTGYREVVAAVERLSAEVAHEKAVNAWNVRMLQKREGALRRAEAKLALLSGTLPARVGKLSSLLVRRARQVAKRVRK